MADLVILAKAAKQIAGAHENGARSMLTNQRGLFPEMRIVGGDFRMSSGVAVPGFSLKPVYTTRSWAETARRHRFNSFSCAVFKFPLMVKLQIRRLHNRYDFKMNIPLKGLHPRQEDIGKTRKTYTLS
jgi:hypothetical protein